MKDICKQAVADAAGRSITQAEAKDIEDRVKNAMRLLAQKDRAGYAAMSQAERMQAAAKVAAEQLVSEAAKKKQRIALTIQAHDRVENYLSEMKQKFPDMDGLEALRRKLAFHSDYKNSGTSIEFAAKAIEIDAIRKMQTVLESTSPKIFGLFTNTTGLNAFVHELFGQDSAHIDGVDTETARLAKVAAKEWLNTAENLRKQFNAEGGEIGRLENYRLPQAHATSRVLKAGEEKWVEDILPHLDRSQYVHEDGRLMSQAEIRDFLKQAWLTIATDGANKADQGMGVRVPSARARRHAEHRSLHFASAEGYLDYMRKYGANDPYSVMVHHIGKMARDIAIVREFGPNPDVMFDHWKNRIIADAAKSDPSAARKMAVKESRKTEQLYDFISGKTMPVANEWVAHGFDTLRNWMVATKLGSAIISSLPDNATMHLTAAVNHIPAMDLFRNQLLMMKPKNAADMRIMRRAGLSMDTFIGEVNRYGADTFGPKFASKAANLTIRASGLNAITEARRRAFGVTMFGALGQTAKDHTTLADLPTYDRAILSSKGVTETNFQVWKRATLEDWGKGNDTMLTPDAIYAIPDDKLADLGDPSRLRRDAALRLLAHVYEELDMAVIVPGAKERAMMVSGLQKGNLKDEILKSFWLFKGFPVATLMKHWRRAIAMPTTKGKAAYIAAYLAGNTVMGAAAQQIYEVINGRDPLDVTDAHFWGRAFLKGGALGVYGDFLFGTNTSYGNTPLAMMAGPAGTYLEDLFNLTQGNAIEAAQGKKTNIGAETVRFVQGSVPLQNLWYTRAVTDRLIFQNLQEMASPGYQRRIEQRARQYGEQYYWRPGHIGPDRPPDIARTVGQ